MPPPTPPAEPDDDDEETPGSVTLTWQEWERELRSMWAQVHVQPSIKDRNTYHITAIGYRRDTGEQHAIKITTSLLDQAADLLEQEWQR